MRINKLKLITVVVISVLCKSNFSQEKIKEPLKEHKHSIGLGYGIQNFYTNIASYNYRYQLPKFNLKGQVDLFLPNNFDASFKESLLNNYHKPKVLSSIDSNGNFYGLDNSHSRRESYVRIAVGGEKIMLSGAQIDLFIGADIYIGFYNREAKASVDLYKLDSVKYLENNYWEGSSNKFGRYISTENIKTTKQNNVVLGGKLTAGFVFNIMKRWNARLMGYIDFSESISKKMRDTFDNTIYQSDFSDSYEGVSYFSQSLIGGSLSVNYKF